MNATLKGFLQNNRQALGFMGLHLASRGVRVSLAHSVISARVAVASHPGRRADGLMCGEMSREQSVAACVASSLLSVYLSPSFSSPSLHLLHLSLSPPIPIMHLFPPPVVAVSWGLQSLAVKGGTRQEASLKRAHRDAEAHLRVVLLENLPVHAWPRRHIVEGARLNV